MERKFFVSKTPIYGLCSVPGSWCGFSCLRYQCMTLVNSGVGAGCRLTLFPDADRPNMIHGPLERQTDVRRSMSQTKNTQLDRANAETSQSYAFNYNHGLRASETLLSSSCCHRKSPNPNPLFHQVKLGFRSVKCDGEGYCGISR